MSLTKKDFDALDLRLKSITEQKVEQIELNDDLPPTITDLEDNNKAFSIMASVLFIDIRHSTYLTDKYQSKSMVKIYRSFMRMAVDCVRKNDGVTRQFLGDRIMGVFIDTVDEAGNTISKSVDKAINTARSLQTVIDYSLNKRLSSNVNGKLIECGIGIDYGKVLVTHVGMHGVEHDSRKEDEVDCVWVGSTTNHASKYADIAGGSEIFISNNVYLMLSDKYKDVWNKSAKYKGTKLFQGYVTKDYYLDYVNDLGKAHKIDNDNSVELDTSMQLSDGIKEIERLQKSLTQREKDIAILEDTLTKSNLAYKSKYEDAKLLKEKAIKEKVELESKYNIVIAETYLEIMELCSDIYYNRDRYKSVLLKDWLKIDTFLHKVGSLKGLDKDTINSDIAYFYIDIYEYYDELELSYSYMLSMAKKNHVWLKINNNTYQRACDRYQGDEIINLLQSQLDNNEISYEFIKDFEGYIVELKEIRGF